MRTLSLLLLAGVLLLPAAVVFGDWDPSMPAKWIQMPDLDQTGIDVNASPFGEDYILADDFLCTQTGPITDIHIFGSWLGDMIPFGDDPSMVRFQLAIYADIPAEQSPTEYSMPGEVLWETAVDEGQFQVRPYRTDIAEGWLDPPDQYQPPPADTVCWQYNFHFDEVVAFKQEGSAAQPVVYWLSLKAFPLDDTQPRFGWKSSLDHWNDDAVWGYGQSPHPGPWSELIYPFGHEFMGQSMDLAFVLDGPSEPEELDFGDAPDPTYPTLLASNGARHTVGALFLGALIDAEPDGQPQAQALGDDFANLPDEDGVIAMSPMIPGQPAQLSVTASMPGLLDAWIDFDGDGTWTSAAEQIFASQTLTAGPNMLTFMVPAGIAGNRATFARFRLSTNGGLSYDGILPTGAVPDGEVEDYEFVIEEDVSYKWYQAPDLETTGIDVNASHIPENYILADDFLCTSREYITEIRVFGSWLGDLMPVDDPNRVVFTLSLHADIPADENPQGYSIPGELLWVMEFQPGAFEVRPRAEGISEGWLDPPGAYLPPPADTVCWEYRFYIEPTEAFLQQGTPEAPVVYWLDVDATPLAEFGPLFGWKTSLDHWNDDAVYGIGVEPYSGPWWELFYPVGHPMEGLSIDLAFGLIGTPAPEDYDYGDAPDTYQTLLASNGPQHLAGPLFMGNLIDTEADGLPGPNADRDDNDNLDDEDGVLFVSALRPNSTGQVDIVASQPGQLDAWIDWNADGIFAASEQIAASLSLPLPLNHVTFSIPAAIAENTMTYARFRFSSAGGLAPGGPYPDGTIPDGEVEDYAVLLDDRYVFKWIQHPDLSPLGIDVNASHRLDLAYILADDFLCTQKGPLTDIHIWGSWIDDYFPTADGVSFTLSIHKDIPSADNPDGFSKPGEVLWLHDFAPGQFEVEVFADQIEEGWLDPPDAYTFPADWTCLLYKFHVDPHLAFFQEGTELEPVVYWLDLQAHIAEDGPRFGWKTAVDHWNDDAVWGIGLEPFLDPWRELIYPIDHQLGGESIDLAFALYSDLVTPVPPDGEAAPSRTGLLYNSPNPFNPMTVIHYVMPDGGAHARLDVFDARGRHVRTLVDRFVAGGPAEATWNGRNDAGQAMPSGVYFYRLLGSDRAQGLKMLLLR